MLIILFKQNTQYKQILKKTISISSKAIKIMAKRTDEGTDISSCESKKEYFKFCQNNH